VGKRGTQQRATPTQRSHATPASPEDKSADREDKTKSRTSPFLTTLLFSCLKYLNTSWQNLKMRKSMITTNQFLNPVSIENHPCFMT